MKGEESTGSGWLSTRNKRKISTPVASVKRRKSAVASRRPLGTGTPSGCYTLTQNSPPPPELFSHTRQTSIDRFFNTPKGKARSQPPRRTEGQFTDNEETDVLEPQMPGTDDTLPLSLTHSLQDEQTTLADNRSQLSDDVERSSTVQPAGKQDSQLTCLGGGYVSPEAVKSPRRSPDTGSQIVGVEDDSSEQILENIDFSSEKPVVKENSNNSYFEDSLFSLDSQRCGEHDADLLLSSQKDFTLGDSQSLTVGTAPLSVSPRVTGNSKIELSDFDTQLGHCASSELNSQWGVQDSDKVEKRTPVLDSEPFTFAFLSQDPTLRTRGITPTVNRQLSKGDNYAITSDEEDFTLSTQNLANSKDQSSELYEEDCLLDSQTLRSDESSVDFDELESESKFDNVFCHKRNEKSHTVLNSYSDEQLTESVDLSQL